MDSRPAARATSLLHHLLLNERHLRSNLWRMNWTLYVVPEDESLCMVLKPKIDDAYTYGGPHTYGMFRPSMPSFNPVNDAEVFNGFGMQSHPNMENRSLGCDERAVYEEALQNFYAAYQSGNKGRRSASRCIGCSAATWPSRGWTVGSVFTS